MKYCVYCGAEIHDEAVVCVKCGRAVKRDKIAAISSTSSDDTVSTVAKIFLVFGCISQGWLLIPLSWCLPITISIFSCMKQQKPIDTGLKICALIFVSFIAGICLLCMDDN